MYLIIIYLISFFLVKNFFHLTLSKKGRWRYFPNLIIIGILIGMPILNTIAGLFLLFEKPLGDSEGCYWKILINFKW